MGLVPELLMNMMNMSEVGPWITDEYGWGWSLDFLL